MSNIISRKTWGARHADGFYNRKVGRLDKWLHHSVTTQLATNASTEAERREMRKLDDIGQSRFKGGISYTFVVFPSGRIYEGHSIGRVGAHTAGRNTVSAGICLAGNYETNEVTAEQIAALAWLLNHGIDKGWWTEPKLDGGHRDTKSTACPGKNAYAQIPAINKLAKSGDVMPVVKPAGKPSTSKPSGQPTDYADLAVDGAFGPKTVSALQIVMRAIGTYSRAVDGSFGRHTARAAQAWLRELGYYRRAIDGDFGKYSVTALQSFLRRKGLYPASKWLLDGDLGPATVKALQSYLNTQN